MADGSGEQTLIKIAIFCIVVSIMSTCVAALLLDNSPDYDYDAINGYKADLVSYSGGQLTNDTPWVLKHVYTPFVPSAVAPEDIPDHIEYDGNRSSGWLYGEEITNYQYLEKAVEIKLDPSKKSNQLLTVTDPYSYEYRNGASWWNGNNDAGIILWNPEFARTLFGWTGGISDDYGYEVVSGSSNNFAFSGYRYVWDPVLPFAEGTSSKDGRLSVVWYDLSNGENGLSGALEVYAGKDNETVKLGSISRTDIISNFYVSSQGYVHVFDFNFDGITLNLTIRFDPTIFEQYGTLQDAWDAGAWSMAISSVSAGNFFDVENSSAFTMTAGSMMDTFIQIYTFNYPHFENDPWAEVIMWLLVGLPMTLAMLFITARLVGGVFKIF